MASLLERELVFVTGKGGTGKTTIAAALGLLAARRGRRTIVVEVGGQSRVAALLGAASADPGEEDASRDPGDRSATYERLSPPQPGEEVRLGECLWSTSIDPDAATIEWLRAVAGRGAARFLGSSSTFRYFVAAAPGAKELVGMVKLLDLLARYDLVVLDAPATGHALGMLRSPQTFSAIARVGPLASRSDQVRALLADRTRSGYVAVAQGSEMAVTETLELEEGLRRLLDRDLDAVIVNGVLPRRFTREEMLSVGELDGESKPLTGSTGDVPTQPAAAARRERLDAVMRSAARAAQAADSRTRVQQSQIARLRRQRFAEGAPARVLTIPFEYTPEMEADAIARMADRLGRSL
jgi:anion-transporting  ArsA/GET3 family ATPase